MPRPKRLEYKNAWILVKNEGKLAQPLFKTNSIKNRFLSILDEMCVQFDIECHGFCLLKNEYILLLHTPKGNLSKGMRHLNGVFTQHYNHYVSPVGTVFKHRYKSVLFEGEDSLKKLSRFVHYLPTQRRVSATPEAYPWSSYQTFLGKFRGPLWLKSRHTLLCFNNRLDRYKAYVDEGTDPETKRFFNRKKWSPMYPAPFQTPLESTKQKLSMEIIIAQTASLFTVTPEQITVSKQGRGQKNTPRYVAIYLARIVGQYDLKDIATAFNVSHVSSITVGIKRFEKDLKQDASLNQKVSLLTKTVGKFGNPSV